MLDHCVCFLWSHHNWIAGTVPLKQSGRVQGLLVTTSADSLGCGAFPGRLLAQTKIHIQDIMKPFPCWLLLEFWLYFLVTFLLIENYRRWAMAVVPLPVPPFPAVTTQGAKRWERSTAGCRGCCNWSCRGCSRGGEEKGRRRVQVRVGGREMTNHKMCTFGIVSGYCNNLRHGCWKDDIHWYPIFTKTYIGRWVEINWPFRSYNFHDYPTASGVQYFLWPSDLWWIVWIYSFRGPIFRCIRFWIFK